MLGEAVQEPLPEFRPTSIPSSKKRVMSAFFIREKVAVTPFGQVSRLNNSLREMLWVKK